MGRKVIVVDDEATVLALLKKKLTENGFEVITSSGGHEALGTIQAENPDVIILDILMPEMDGYTLLLELKKIENFTVPPVIILTAKSEMEEVFRMEGVKDYLVKPFQTDELIKKLEKIVSENNS